MKIFLLPCLCVVALTLSGCSLLGSVGSLLASPLSTLGGLAKAVTRTVSQAPPPAEAPHGTLPGTQPVAEPGAQAVAQRGSQIAARGAFRGKGTAPVPESADSVARR